MNRFRIALGAGLLAVLSVSVLPAMADNTSAALPKFDPPMMEDMIKLEVYQDLKQLPEVHLTQDNAGITNLSESKGKLVLLNVWATWCPPCVKELPSLNALQLAMGSDNFQVITVSLDKDTQGQKDAKKFMEDNKLTALQPYTDGYGELQKLDALKDVPGIPVSLILDKSMHVLARYQGDADWNGRAARAVIDYYQKNTPAYNPYDALKEVH